MSTAEQEVPESVTFREVQELLRTFQESGWSGMTVELHGMRITVGKHGPPAAPAAPAEPSPVAERPARVPEVGDSRVIAPPPSRESPTPDTRVGPDLAGCIAVTSPAVGAFWVAPSPGQPPFVQVGDVVAQDQQLAIVEVMKLMNPVVASAAGTVVHVAAANADLVEFEQPLFWIRP